MRKYIKKYITHILLAIWVILIPTMFAMADYERGYNATGGEIMWLILPILIFCIKDTYDEFKDSHK